MTQLEHAVDTLLTHLLEVRLMRHSFRLFVCIHIAFPEFHTLFHAINHRRRVSSRQPVC
ncbi:MAG: hypothetical protein ACK41O_27170 [Runella zeae]